MGSVMSEIECSNCGFEYATEDYYYKSSEVYIFCSRCGYTESEFIANRDDLKNKKTKTPRYKHEKIGGHGCYCYRTKGAIAFALGPVKKGLIQELSKHIKKMDKCNYTYKWQGKWFIKDLLTGKKMPFAFESQVN